MKELENFMKECMNKLADEIFPESGEEKFSLYLENKLKYFKEKDEKLNKIIDTLEGKIYNQLNSVIDNLYEIQYFCVLDYNVPILEIPENIASTYRDLDLNYAKKQTEEYLKILSEMKTDFTNRKELIMLFFNEVFSLYFEDMPVTKLKKMGFDINKINSIEDLNIHLKKLENKLSRKSIVEPVDREMFYKIFEPVIEAKKELKKQISFYDTVDILEKKTRNMLVELQKNISFIENIKSKQFNKSNEETYFILMELLNENISRNKALKQLSSNYNNEVIIKKEESNLEKIVENINCKEISKINSQNEFTDYKQKEYDKEKMHYLINKGFKTNIAKEIIDSDYNLAKEFIDKIENLFTKYNLDLKETEVILDKTKNLIINQKKSSLLSYYEKLEELFSVFDPSKVSGILPKNNNELYDSVDCIDKFIRTSNNDSVVIFNYEFAKIENDKIKTLFENKLKAAPLNAGEKVKKYYTKGFKKRIKTEMYEKYSEIAGEGLYIKCKFGDDKRAIYKIMNIGQGVFKVDLINYFDVHEHYTKFFKNNK